MASKRQTIGEQASPALRRPIDRLAYSCAEAGAVVSLSESNIRDLVRCGQLEALKAGGRTIITVDALRDWLSRLPKAQPGPGEDN